MGTYAIGDIQGCFQELQDLLNVINFDNTNDKLWFTGDLVNRGPQSLKALRFIKNLDAIIVLGNHDLHLLAIAAGIGKLKKGDTLDSILNASDKNELLSWLYQQPLMHHDDDLGFTLVHAGLAPQWDLAHALNYAREVETVLRGTQSMEFISHMYGDQPDQWSDDLDGWDRIRFIINCFTRIRFCDTQGKLNLQEKGPPGTQPASYVPWYQVGSRKSRNLKITFGHWASVKGGEKQDFKSANVYPLDTGCVWGRELTAIRLEDEKYFSVPSRQ